ncbi:MAG: hypothetical protein KF713_00425 [Turneriella sp.]|nr:hypothetical protein [Turneriella sp.]
MFRSLIVFLLLLPCLTCGKEKPKTARPKSPGRAHIIRAFFNSPLKVTEKLDGFWSVDAKEFSDFITKSRQGKSGAESFAESIDLKKTRYFLRIEGTFCDELFFVDGGDFTISAGAIKKLESAKDRTAYSVVFNREVPGGIKLSQGAILSWFRAEKRLVLEFPDHKLTFFPETEAPAVLAGQFGADS